MEDEIDFDWTSCYAIPNVSFILSQVAPLRHCTGTRVKQIQDQITAQTGNLSKSGVKAIPCGDIFDGYTIPLYYRRDQPQGSLALQYEIIRLLEDVLVIRSSDRSGHNAALILDDKKTNIGFTRLKVEPTTSENKILVAGKYSLNDQTYLSSSAIQAHVKKEFNVPVQENICENPLVGIRLHGWPEAASKWVSRERKSNWPGEKLVKAASEEACLLVPGHHHHSTNSQVEWTYCFTLPEQKLFEAMNPIQRQCMVLLRILRDQSMSFPCILSDYHLKTVFLWACERIPSEEWTFLTMGTYFIYLVDFLMECIIYQNLPHYFMPDWNLFEGLCDDFQDHLLKLVAEIRRNPLQPFYSFMEQNSLPYLPEDKSFEKLYAVIDKDKAHDGYLSILQKHQIYSREMSKRLLKENKIEEALQVLDLCGLSNFYDPLLQLSPNADILASIALDMGSAIGIKVFQYLVADDPKASYLGNLGCMYHVQYCEAEGDEKEEWRGKAEDAFQKAISLKDATSSTKIDYCHFLYGLQDQETVRPLLKDIIEEEQKSEAHSCSNCYGLTEVVTADENLQQEIQARGAEVSLTAYGYAHYMMVQMSRDTMTPKEVEAMLRQFWTACEVLEGNLSEPSEKAMCWNLYGYAAKDAGQIRDARQGFSKALKCDRSLPLIQININACDEIIATLEQPEEGTKAKSTSTAQSEKEAMTVKLPQEIETIRSMHTMYLSLPDPKQKENFRETISTMCRALLHQPNLSGFIEIDFASFLLEIHRADGALSVLDSMFSKQRLDSVSGLHLTSLRRQDAIMVDNCIKEDILEVEEGTQYIVPTLALGFYLAVKALVQLEQFDEARKMLHKFEDTRLQATKREIDPLHIETFSRFHKYALAELQAKSPQDTVKEIPTSPATTDAARFLEVITRAKQIRSLHLQYAQAKDDSERREFKESITAVYEQLNSLPDARMVPSFKLDYANFLYHAHQYRDALVVLDEVLEAGSASENIAEGIIGYSQDETAIVDANIVSEIGEYDAMIIPLPLRGYLLYLTIQCLYKLEGGCSEACGQTLLSMMSLGKPAKLVYDDHLMATWYRLIGHAAMDTEQLKLAIKAFQTAVTLQPQNEHAVSLLQKCDDLLTDEIEEKQRKQSMQSTGPVDGCMQTTGPMDGCMQSTGPVDGYSGATMLLTMSTDKSGEEGKPRYVNTTTGGKTAS